MHRIGLVMILTSWLGAGALNAAPEPNVARLDRDGNMLLTHKQYEQALEKFTAAIAISSNYAPAIAHAAQCYEKLGLPETASTAWKRAGELDTAFAATAATRRAALEGKPNLVIPVTSKDDDLWRQRWKLTSSRTDEWHAELDGHTGVLKTHPKETTEPALLHGSVACEKKPLSLHLYICVKGEGDSLVDVSANGESLEHLTITGAEWRKLDYNLTRFWKAGTPIEVEIRHAAGGKELWSFESAFWDYINVAGR